MWGPLTVFLMGRGCAHSRAHLGVRRPSYRCLGSRPGTSIRLTEFQCGRSNNEWCDKAIARLKEEEDDDGIQDPAQRLEAAHTRIDKLTDEVATLST